MRRNKVGLEVVASLDTEVYFLKKPIAKASKKVLKEVHTKNYR